MIFNSLLKHVISLFLRKITGRKKHKISKLQANDINLFIPKSKIQQNSAYNKISA
jgi:hypothetical protein